MPTNYVIEEKKKQKKNKKTKKKKQKKKTKTQKYKTKQKQTDVYPCKPNVSLYEAGFTESALNELARVMERIG